MIVAFCNRKQTSLWAAGREYRQRESDTAGKPQTERCLVTIVNSLSLDDNLNCENSAVAVDDVDNMACIIIITAVVNTAVFYFCLCSTFISPL